jgi:hypothetical protein
VFKRLCLSAIVIGWTVIAAEARADTVRFVCKSEESANTIGEALAEGEEMARQAIHPFLMFGECEYLDDKMFVYVVHRGTTYGTTSKITVVGLSQKMGEFPKMWSLVPTDDLRGDGTI